MLITTIETIHENYLFASSNREMIFLSYNDYANIHMEWFYRPTLHQQSELRKFYADIREKAFHWGFGSVSGQSNRIIMKWLGKNSLKILTAIGEDEDANFDNCSLTSITKFQKKRERYYRLFRDIYGYYLNRDLCSKIITKHVKVALGIWNNEKLQDFHFRICMNEIRHNFG